MVTRHEFNSVPLVASELTLPARSVEAVLKLLAEGGTVPFIARYRKEATGGLDETQIRAIEERNSYLKELDQRRQAILEAIAKQDKLSDELRAKIIACTTKSALEDLYLPYKPKRRTRAIIAREKGLEPLAERIWQQPLDGDPFLDARHYLNAEKGVPDADSALAGARDIVAERMSEDAEVRARARALFTTEGQVRSEAVPKKTQQPTKFEQYYNFGEAVVAIPSHRFLAIQRGVNEGVLRVRIEVAPERVLPLILTKLRHNPGSPFAEQLSLAVQDGVDRLLLPSLESDVLAELKTSSDRTAVEVFASNLRNLLLAAPLGAKPVLGVDPGLRTGCKCAALSDTGAFLETTTIFPTQGEARAAAAARELTTLIGKHQPFAIAIGNGTAGRETEAFVRNVISEAGPKAIVVIMVSEAGASVYSASEIAREEFPELDVTVRGAMSIGRRLQDPLAELVKIDPKAIGVGQYQHDVHQLLLQRKLEEVVESCVNLVGVELNTASASLLSRVAGIGPALAQKIVLHRQRHGAFQSRQKLLEVAGLGPRTFEQAAGFLRIRGGSHPLDASAVHPERYDLVEMIARDLNISLDKLVGNAALADQIPIQRYVGDGVGEPTLRDIVDELKKPGRDPREKFEPLKFRDDATTLADLKPGMVLEGQVTNVTAFGAFVDVGVHRDGLVHISQLSDRFIKDPHEVVKVGTRLTVRVLEVDLARDRLSLTAKSDQSTTPPTQKKPSEKHPGKTDAISSRGEVKKTTSAKKSEKFSFNPFADALKPKRS
jgi:uncharacterized protein